MNRSTGIVIGISAAAGFIAAWATIAAFDPDKSRSVAQTGTAPTPSRERMNDLWTAGDMGVVIYESGLWSVDAPESPWPRYYRACAHDRIGQDSARSWQLVAELAEAELAVGDFDFDEPSQSRDHFWMLYLKGVALVRLDRADEGEPVLAEAIAGIEDRPGTFRTNSVLYLRSSVESVLGRPDAAIDLLEESIAQSNDGRPFWYSWITHDPEFADIVEHPRFVALMERLEAPRDPD